MKGQIYIATSDEDKVLLEFCFLGGKRRFINNFNEGFCFVGGKRRFIKNFNVDNLDITPMEQVALENAHYRKIEISDAIYVVDIQGYIGKQVSKEIAFAKSKGKEVIFHSAYIGN